MKTLTPTPEAVAEAAMAIRSGDLVVMPTETVYGLAADAFNADAIRRVYAAKGRPSESPLIVHVGSIDQLAQVAASVPELAQRLAERFWPGPLTIVVPKHPDLPSEVTGGLDTVAVRMPDHGVALALIAMAGTPIAAPSANRYMQLSPTKMEHICREVAVAAVIGLDGGPSQVGVESTVVDVTCDPPRLLRPGGISRGQLQAALGAPLAGAPATGPNRSPGMASRHYAPVSPLVLVAALEAGQSGLGFGVSEGPHQVRMPDDPAAYAASLYDALHALDRSTDVLYVVQPPDTPEWEAVWDRLRRASAK